MSRPRSRDPWPRRRRPARPKSILDLRVLGPIVVRLVTLLGPGRSVALVTMIVLAGLGIWLVRQDGSGAPRTAPAASAEGYLFCTWNVENFFDDQDDPQNHDEDEDWFAQH